MDRCKIYNIQEYIVCYQLVEYVEYLTGSKLTSYDLQSLVRNKNIDAYILIEDLITEYLDSVVTLSRGDNKSGFCSHARIIDGHLAMQINNEQWGGMVSAFPSYDFPITIELVYADNDSSNSEAHTLKIYKTKPIHQYDVRELGRDEYGLDLYYASEDIRVLADMMNDNQTRAPEKKANKVTPATGNPTVYKYQQQHALILKTLQELGFPADCLPKPTNKGGAKASVKSILVGKEPFKTLEAFNNAWKELRNNGEIKDSASN